MAVARGPRVPTGLETFLAELDRFPLLSPAEEQRLARAYRSTGDRRIAHRLVTANLRFVVKVAREYRSHATSLPDLIQEGNVALTSAVERFDPEKGVRLVTYAVWAIRAAMLDFIGGREVEAVSLDLGSGGSPDTSLHETLSSERSDQEQELSIAQEEATMRCRVGAALSRLLARERYIVEQHLMSERRSSLTDIAARLAVSSQRSLQLQNRALRKLEKDLRGLATEMGWEPRRASRGAGCRPTRRSAAPDRRVRRPRAVAA
jgi:RNA polymerase sigma factor (sigma-70 family)